MTQRILNYHDTQNIANKGSNFFLMTLFIME
jgi:hypothetical protein